MTTVWIICGAGRGVGKTHLAQRLCDILPNSVYAKCGHGKAKASKSASFFSTQAELASFIEACRDSYDHIVAESNALARRGKGDIIVFVDSVAGETDVRGDVERLRSAAQLRVHPGASLREWKRVLRGKLTDKGLREAICDALADQRRYLSKSGLAVRTKVWFTLDNLHVFGAGLARLLEGVERFGTLREAAQVAQMSYRYAWGLIKTAEKHLGKQLVLPRAGGVGGGRSALSPEGKHLLEVFSHVNKEVADYADRRFAAHYHKGAPDEKV